MVLRNLSFTDDMTVIKDIKRAVRQHHAYSLSWGSKQIVLTPVPSRSPWIWSHPRYEWSGWDHDSLHIHHASAWTLESAWRDIHTWLTTGVPPESPWATH